MSDQAWLQRMTASKIAAVVGLSPYESRFSLWHRMAGQIVAQESTPTLQRGHYLEDGIRRWLFDQHPEWNGPHLPVPDEWVELPDGRRHPLWLDKDNNRFGCSPDGWVNLDTLVEIKTASDSSEWGEPGTDQIPLGYKCQVQWQMMVTGARVTHVGVLSAYLNLAEYVVPYDEDDAAYLRREAVTFLDSLPGGPAEKRPDLDAHSATYEAIRRLHPDIEADDIDLDHDLAAHYCTSRYTLDAAKADEQLARSRVMDAIGTGRRALFNGKTIATRQAKGDKPPYLVAGRALPTFNLKEAS